MTWFVIGLLIVFVLDVLGAPRCAGLHGRPLRAPSGGEFGTFTRMASVIGARFVNEYGSVFQITDVSASKRTVYFAAYGEAPRCRTIRTVEIAHNLTHGKWLIVRRDTPLTKF